MKTRTKNNIIVVFLVIISMLVCIGAVAFVYVSKYGTPNSEENVLPILEEIAEKIDVNPNSNVSVKLEDKSIIFEKQISGVATSQMVKFEYLSYVFTAKIPNSTVDNTFKDAAILMMFEAVAEYLEQDRSLAIYALDDELISTKTLKADGYELVLDNENNMTIFKISIDKKLNLISKEDSYFSKEQILGLGNTLARPMEYARLNKENLILEKNISYNDYMIFSIYEAGALSSRAHNALISLLTAVTSEEKAKYVKDNYPVITKDGILILDGVILSINKDYPGFSHVSYVTNKEYGGYIRIYIDMNTYGIEEVV